MRNLFARLRRPPAAPVADGSTIVEDMDRLDRALDHMSTMSDLAADLDEAAGLVFSDLEQERIGEIEAHWSKIYAMQTEVLANTLAALEAQTAIVDQARSFMTVLAQRGQSGHPLFMVNDAAGPDAAAQLRHAILTLQALLEGTEVPALVLTDRVLH